MEKRNGPQKKRGPRNIKNRDQHWRGEQSLHRFQIAQARRCAFVGDEGGFANDRIKNPTIKPGLKPRTDTGHDPAACIIQNPHDSIEKHHQNRYGDQGRNRAAAKHAIIDL
jgi:hypothetical protein